MGLSRGKRARPLFDPPIVRRAIVDSFVKLNPVTLAKNPVMFVVEVGALLIVSSDTDLLSMSPWRGTPIIEPAAFAAKVDAMRRHARRRRR